MLASVSSSPGVITLLACLTGLAGASTTATAACPTTTSAPTAWTASARAARTTTAWTAAGTHEGSHAIATRPTGTTGSSRLSAKWIRTACTAFHAARSKTSRHSFWSAKHHQSRTTEARKILTGSGASPDASAHQEGVGGSRFAERTGVNLRHGLLAWALTQRSLQFRRINLLKTWLTRRGLLTGARACERWTLSCRARGGPSRARTRTWRCCGRRNGSSSLRQAAYFHDQLDGFRFRTDLDLKVSLLKT